MKDIPILGLRKMGNLRRGRDSHIGVSISCSWFALTQPKASHFISQSPFTKTSYRIDQENYRKRLAALSLSSLLNRCRTTLVGYIADESLRGNLPFPRFVFSNSPSLTLKKIFISIPRAREDELIYVLRKLLGLRLWPGSLWASLSDNPTEHCISQPGNFPFLGVFIVYSLIICVFLIRRIHQTGHTSDTQRIDLWFDKTFHSCSSLPFLSCSVRNCINTEA